MNLFKKMIAKVAKKRLALHIEPRISKGDRYVLKHLIQSVFNENLIVVEIGSFLGNGSTKAFLDEIRSKKGSLYCVDTWKGNTNVAWHSRLAAEYDFFSTFTHNVDLYGGSEIVKPLVMDSLSAAKIFKNNSCDLIFIDGDHSYEAVKRDIDSWFPKLRKGGLLCGHDCEGRLSELDERLIKSNKDKDFIEIPNYKFAGVHPGIVLCVDEVFNSNAFLWAEENLGTEIGPSSIWHIIK
ncbi:MAG: class I SAM-dependent methyltransferase [Desulfobacteraceae bacterium]|nr:class I SAM-dependent methyltransferase [Desulfobacteraceae bacterium]